MKTGILVKRAPLLATISASSDGTRTLLAGGRWNYLSVAELSEPELAHLGELDGYDTVACRSDIETIVEALLDAGTFDVVPYDQNPSRLLVLETYLLLVVARAFVAVAPRGSMALIARNLASTEPSSAGWLGQMGESIMASLHRAVAYPAATTRCVPIAIAVYWLLKRRGAEAKFCLSAVSAPFEAHVWVRYGERDIDPRCEAFAGTSLQVLDQQHDR